MPKKAFACSVCGRDHFVNKHAFAMHQNWHVRKGEAIGRGESIFPTAKGLQKFGSQTGTVPAVPAIVESNGHAEKVDAIYNGLRKSITAAIVATLDELDPIEAVSVGNRLLAEATASLTQKA